MDRTAGSGGKFLDDFLEGQRNFRGLILMNADLSVLPRFQEAVGYSKTQYGESGYGEGVDFGGAQLKNVKMPGLCLTGSTFDNAELSDVSATGSSIDYSSFIRAKISGLDISGGSLSCGMFVATQAEKMNFSGARVFETAFENAILLDALGIGDTTFFQTSQLQGVLVDPETYKSVQTVFPVHSPLVAIDVQPGQKLPDGRDVPAGSVVINGRYYLNAFF